MPLNLGVLAPGTRAIHRAVDRIHKLGCVTPVCTSVVRLHDVFDIVLDGESTTMGGAHCFDPDQPHVQEKRLHAVLLDHPDRFGSMCALLTSLASRYGRPGAQEGADYELFVGVTALDLALRMDGFGPPHCLAAVLAAMPPTLEADTAIGNERTLCENEPVARNPCARIVRTSEP